MPFLSGTSPPEPTVIPISQASSFRLQYFRCAQGVGGEAWEKEAIRETKT
jgi:hypothetical protein